MPNSTKSSLWRQPAGVYVVAIAEFWERFSYYGLVALLVLFLSGAPADGGLGWTQAQALQTYGVFAGLAFCLPAAGGWLADRWLGERRGVLLGGLGILLGNLVLFFMTLGADPSAAQLWLMLGLGLIVLGTGLLKPAISTLVGRVYDGRPHLARSGGYTLFLMCIWMGSVAGTLLAGALGETIGFRWGFLVSALGMAAGLLVYALMAPRTLGEVGLKPARATVEAAGGTAIPAAIPAILLMTLFTALYATGFYQKAGVLTLMVKSQTDRMVLGVELPASAFLTISTAGFVILAPIFEIALDRLARRGLGLDVFQKQALALAALGIGYAFFLGAVHQSAGGALHSPWWIVAGYLCFSVGDVLIWPPQISTISRLAPVRLTGLLIGLWYVTVGIGNYLAGFLGVAAQTIGLAAYFMVIQAGLAIGALALLTIRLAAPRLRAAVAIYNDGSPQ
ncbi:peptide MFS transporter [Caulobacter segnis]|uniref:peptide MFS transporter n=1 Tax=Caulobacter segnis TaxID=88688 RepID=UPI00240F6DA0|nr:peptide MFS transporter [Caulobacter segnis]MDG2521216.1 peptide MFS transporter [Caulobacter segnis]